MRFLTFLLMLCVASVAGAATEGSWTDCSGVTEKSAVLHTSRCWAQTTSTGDSPPLTQAPCSHGDLVFWPDYDGDGTASDSTFTPQLCPTGPSFRDDQGNWNDTLLNAACKTMAGATTGDTDLWLTPTAGRLRLLRATGSANPTHGTWEFKCNDGS